MIIRSLNKLEVTSDIVIRLTNIYKNIGKQELYKEEIKDDLKQKILFTAENNTYYITKLLGLNISDARLEHIIKTRKKRLNNKVEETVMNLHKMFCQLLASENEELLYNTVIKDLVDATYGQQFRSEFNEITKRINTNNKVESYNNIDEADAILEIVRNNKRKKEYEDILLSIIAFVDYYNTQLFKEKHKVTSILVLFMMLLKQDLIIIRQVSLFKHIFENRNEFEEALIDISLYKEEEIIKPLAMQRFVLKLIDDMYDEFETYVLERRFDKTLNKTQNIVQTIFKLPEIFKKSDIVRQLPNVSEVTINKTLQLLQSKDIIKPVSKGRGASWIRIVVNENEFNFNELADIKLSDLNKK